MLGKITTNTTTKPSYDLTPRKSTMTSDWHKTISWMEGFSLFFVGTKYRKKGEGKTDTNAIIEGKTKSKLIIKYKKTTMKK